MTLQDLQDFLKQPDLKPDREIMVEVEHDGKIIKKHLAKVMVQRLKRTSQITLVGDDVGVYG